MKKILFGITGLTLRWSRKSTSRFSKWIKQKIWCYNTYNICQRRIREEIKFKSKIKNTGVCAGIAAVLGTLTNTIGVLGLTYILYLDQYAQAREISREAVAGTLLTVGLTNGIPEAIVSALITIPIVVTMLKLKRN